jgi:RimJ/RimL family protein N-acetyltransferase
MIRAVPMINTSRLTLRSLRTEDFERFAEIWEQPEVVKYITGKPRSRGQSWTAFLRNAGQWQITGFGNWAIDERASNRLIGQVGFFHGGRDLGPDFDKFPEAGWVLAPEAQSRGLGTEAVRAVHDWYDRVIPGPLVAIIHPKNTVSIKMATRLGYSELRDAKYEGKQVLLFRRDKAPQV